MPGMHGRNKPNTDSTKAPGGKKAKPGAPTFNNRTKGARKVGQMTTGRSTRNIRRSNR